VALASGGLAAAAGSVAAETAPPARKKLIVHEWGTFLTVQGSDGVTLGGMIDSEEDLPLFVRERSLSGRNRACLFCKMETPVTYFYVDQPMTVELRVGMPRGLLTHWFPAVRGFGPPQENGKPVVPVNSHLDWGPIELIPSAAKAPAPGLRPIPQGNTWGFARETDAAFVKIGPTTKGVRKEGELEKFLFYRGLGAFDLPLAIRSSGDGDVRLALHNRGPEGLAGLFAVQVAKDGIQFGRLPDLAGSSRHDVTTGAVLSAKQPLASGVPQAKQAVAAALVEAGLYAKEAAAMVNTWEKSYFRSEGLRVLYVLPRDKVDEIIPIQVKPSPQQLVRVMVGRVEVLTPATEQRIARAVSNLGSRDAAVKRAAEAELARLGRLQEPALHRVVATDYSAAVRGQAEVLLKKIAARP
jgi:hypothetical protein